MIKKINIKKILLHYYRNNWVIIECKNNPVDKIINNSIIVNSNNYIDILQNKISQKNKVFLIGEQNVIDVVYLFLLSQKKKIYTTS